MMVGQHARSDADVVVVMVGHSFQVEGAVSIPEAGRRAATRLKHRGETTAQLKSNKVGREMRKILARPDGLGGERERV